MSDKPLPGPFNGRRNWLGDSFGKPLDGGIPGRNGSGKGGGFCLFLAFVLVGFPIGLGLAAAWRVVA